MAETDIEKEFLKNHKYVNDSQGCISLGAHL